MIAQDQSTSEIASQNRDWFSMKHQHHEENLKISTEWQKRLKIKQKKEEKWAKLNKPHNRAQIAAPEPELLHVKKASKFESKSQILHTLNKWGQNGNFPY